MSRNKRIFSNFNCSQIFHPLTTYEPNYEYNERLRLISRRNNPNLARSFPSDFDRDLTRVDISDLAFLRRKLISRTFRLVKSRKEKGVVSWRETQPFVLIIESRIYSQMNFPSFVEIALLLSWRKSPTSWSIKILLYCKCVNAFSFLFCYTVLQRMYELIIYISIPQKNNFRHHSIWNM